MEDKHEKEREKKKTLSYICNWKVRQIEMTWEVQPGEEKVWIRGKTGHMSQKGVSLD